MRRLVYTRYLGPAIVAILTILYGAYTSIRSTRENVRAFEGVSHTQAVLRSLHDVLSAVRDLETGQRGYLLTSKPEFLEPYRLALAQLDSHFADLENLTRNTPDQASIVRRLRQATELKRQELAASISILETEGRDAAIASVDHSRGKNLMDQVRQAAQQLESFETQRLENRQHKLIESFRHTNTSVVASGVIAILSGITGALILTLYLQSRNRQERLRFEKEKAEQADRSRAEFLTMMSHEIRTPMNAIIGFGEMLASELDHPRLQHNARTIVHSGHALLTLINDLLDLSRIESAKLELHPETVEVDRFFEGISHLFAPRAESKQLQFLLHLDRSIPPLLRFDPLRLRQILVNLVGNALKFTPEGSVTLSATLIREAGRSVELLIRVEDTGIGIPADKLKDIFRPFYQIESLHGRRYEGTGLGLHICERLAQLMQGSIRAESRFGGGSTFTVRIPVDPLSPAASAIDSSLSPSSSNPPLRRAEPRPSPVEIWPKLALPLESLLSSTLPSLIDLVPAQGTLRFAMELKSLAENHHCSPLADFADRLADAASLMEFAEAGKLLRSFPSLVAKLTQDHAAAPPPPR